MWIHLIYFLTATEKENDLNPFILLSNLHRERKNIMWIHLIYFQTKGLTLTVGPGHVFYFLEDVSWAQAYHHEQTTYK
jgi:hypothetical protein